jgi:hypothetical protein
MATIEIDRPAAPRREAPLRRSRPSTEYWDFRTAGWQVASPIPAPRRGD